MAEGLFLSLIIKINNVFSILQLFSFWFSSVIETTIFITQMPYKLT